MFKKNIGIGGDNPQFPLHIQTTSAIYSTGSDNYFDIASGDFEKSDSGIATDNPGSKKLCIINKSN